MKNILKSGIIALMIFTFSACENWLDIRPESEIVLEDFWQNESHVSQVMAAAYRSLTEYACMDRMMIYGELRSDNVTFGNGIPEDMQKMLNVDISPDNVYCHWGAFYTVINICNNFLYYAPDVVQKDPNFSESELHAMEAEVLTLRALVYFYLVRTFNEVPYIDAPSIDDSQDFSIPKSSEDYILDRLVEDLENALLYSRDRFDIEEYNRGRITTNAIRALLADIHLWRENYASTVLLCDQIINDQEQGLQLVNGEDVLEEVFYKGNSTETIFELQFDDENWFNYALRDIYGLEDNKLGAWSFPAIFVTGEASPFSYQAPSGRESEDDIREKDFLFPGGDKYYVFKYAGALRREDPNSGVSSYIHRSTSPNWIVYRLPDILLMKAEALIQQETDLDVAMEMINTTYLRSNPELKEEDALKLENYSSKLDMESLLLRERQRELMFEGKRWFDLMRLARRADSPTPLLNQVMKKYSGTATIQATKMSVMNALYLPIHTDELKANQALEQNPFYELTSETTKN